jgi:hypothetical protein
MVATMSEIASDVKIAGATGAGHASAYDCLPRKRRQSLRLLGSGRSARGPSWLRGNPPRQRGHGQIDAQEKLPLAPIPKRRGQQGPSGGPSLRIAPLAFDGMEADAEAALVHGDVTTHGKAVADLEASQTQAERAAVGAFTKPQPWSTGFGPCLCWRDASSRFVGPTGAHKD